MNATSSTFSREAPSSRPARARLYPNVSCVTFVPDGTVSLKELNYFDVLPEEYSDGTLTGAKLAWEALAASADFGGPALMESIIKAAAAVIAQPPAPGHGRVGAAVGFLGGVASVLYDAACNGRIHSVLAEEIAGYEESRQADLDDLRAQNKAFMASMMVAAGKSAAPRRARVRASGVTGMGSH